MERLDLLYNYQPLGLLLFTAETFIEHLQALAFLKYGFNPDHSAWTEKALDFLNWLFDHFFIDTTDHYLTYFTICSVIIGAALFFYICFLDKIHSTNSKSFSFTLGVILVIDHVVFGIGTLVMLKIVLDNHYCDNYDILLSDSDIDCWGDQHLLIMWAGLIFTGVLLLFYCGIFPILRAERTGIEKPFGNDFFCPGLYRLFMFTCITAFPWIREPYLAVLIGSGFILYYLLYEGYENEHVARVKIASLAGIVWGYASAERLRTDQEAGSDMLLIGWGFSLMFGYALLMVKHVFLPRRPVELSIDKLI